MISITTFTIASDFQSLDIVIDAGAGQTVDELLFYIGSDYLSETPIDLSSMLSGVQVETLNITIEDLGLSEDYLQGIITVHTTASDATEVESSVMNSFFVDLSLAKMISLNNIQSDYNDIEVISLMLEATKTYISSGFTEQALNIYERIEGMLENYSEYMVVDDIPACTSGTGCWIINGKYIIN